MPQVGVPSSNQHSFGAFPVFGGLTLLNTGRNLKTWWNFEDFICGDMGSAGIYLYDTAGAGASIAGYAGSQTRPGQGIGGTGTTNVGRAFWKTNIQNIMFGGGVYTYESEFYLPILSTAIEEFDLYFGYGDTFTADQVDGVYFRYNRPTSVNWLACTSNNSVRTETDTLVPVVAGAWIRPKVVVNAAGNSAAFYINNILVATNVANIPTARETGSLSGILKTVGVTSRSVIVDWIWQHIDLAVSR